MSSNNDDNVSDHPALKNFNATLEYAKAIGGKALKWGAKAAIILGVGAALLALVPPGLLATLNAVTFGISGAIVGSGSTAAVVPALMAGIKTGGIVGLILGGISGAAESGDVVEDKKEAAIAAYERREVREERMAMVDQRREQQRLALANQAQSMGLSSGLNLPFGPGSNERQM